MNAGGFLSARAVALAGLATAAACATSGAAAGRDGGDLAYDGVVIVVENTNVADARVYLTRGSIPFPVGSVPGMSSRTFQLSAAEARGAEEMRLAFRTLGSTALSVTDPIYLAPGRVIVCTIHAAPGRSTISVAR